MVSLDQERTHTFFILKSRGTGRTGDFDIFVYNHSVVNYFYKTGVLNFFSV